MMIPVAKRKNARVPRMLLLSMRTKRASRTEKWQAGRRGEERSGKASLLAAAVPAILNEMWFCSNYAANGPVCREVLISSIPLSTLAFS